MRCPGPGGIEAFAPAPPLAGALRYGRVVSYVSTTVLLVRRPPIPNRPRRPTKPIRPHQPLPLPGVVVVLPVVVVVVVAGDEAGEAAAVAAVLGAAVCADAATGVSARAAANSTPKTLFPIAVFM